MKNSRSVRFAIRMGMMLALLAAAYAGRAIDDTGGEAFEVSSEKGQSPNASISSIGNLKVDTFRQNLMYNVPMSPNFKVADGVSYGISASYSSNIFTAFAGYGNAASLHPYFSYIPTLKSPFGVGYEFGFGQIYLNYQGHDTGSDSEGDRELDSFHRQFVLQTPDGSSHQLYLLASAPVDSVHLKGGVPVGGEPLGAHLKGDAYHIQSGLNAPWTVLINPNAEYYTADGSLIRAIFHQATSFYGSPAFWEIFYPDGRKVIFAKQFKPDEASLQSKYYKRCTTANGNSLPNLNSDYPQEMLGWYPTRIENARSVGFNLYYEDTNPNYGYLVTRISDDTDRKYFPDQDGRDGDIHFTIGTADSGITAGRYTDISYPGANGHRQNVHLTYISQPFKYRTPWGEKVCTTAANCSALFPGLDQSSFSPPPLTLLQKVEMPGGHTQTFGYYPECDADTNACRASGRVNLIHIPTGGVHQLEYQKYLFYIGDGATVDLENIGVSRHTIKVRDFATGTADTMIWNYRQTDLNNPPSNQARLCTTSGPPNFTQSCNIENIVADPAGNETVYLFNGGGRRGDLFGTLSKTDFFQGTMATGAHKKRVTKGWQKFDVSYDKLDVRKIGFTDPAKPQLVSTTTEYWDDMVGGAPGTLIEENQGWDYWGHFTIKLTRGTLVQKMRRIVTDYSLKRALFTLTQEPMVPAGIPFSGVAVELSNSIPGSCTQTGTNIGPNRPNSLPNIVPNLAHWAMLPSSNCPYLEGALSNWRLSLPLSVELQEYDIVTAEWITKSRAETRFDLATGLPTRTITRKNPRDTGATTSTCTATISPQTGALSGDMVTDFYYDDRGNLALKKSYGADNTAVFRTYMGTGDKPAAQADPATTGIPATIFPPGANENIYSNAGGYFGFDRWSREYSPEETTPHRFLNSFVDATATDIERTSGAILQSHDANGMTSKTEYDSLGRVFKKTFLGNGQPGSGDKPAEYSYINQVDSVVMNDPGGGLPVVVLIPRLVSLKSVQEDSTPGNESQRLETQDYYDGLGRKVITRRLNPDGQFAYLVIHFDESGHTDLVSNWSFTVPPGINADGTVSSSASWTDIPLKNYILNDVGAFTKTCYRPACVSTPGTYEFAGRPLRIERIGNGSAMDLISRVDTEYFGFNTQITTYGLNSTNASSAGAITTHYTDGYGNLRIVDADNDGTKNPGAAEPDGIGADAIYDYDYANRLVKVNLVTQVALIPISDTNQNRYATSNSDNQTRYFKFDALGRQTMAHNQENSITRYLKFNALGQVLDEENENGRSGGGPGGGVFDETLAGQPIGTCPLNNGGSGYCTPTMKISGFENSGGEIFAQWTATGKRRLAPGPGNFVYPSGAALYYQAVITDSQNNSRIVIPWTLGVQSYREAGFVFGETYKLTVYATYFSGDPDGVAGNAEVTFTSDYAPKAYHLIHEYDSRGREIFVKKQPFSNGVPSGTPSILRQFSYEIKPSPNLTPCATDHSCGKLVLATAKRAGTADVHQSFTFRAKDGRLETLLLNAPHVNRPANTLAFDYDGFGRQNLATYPDGRQILLEFQSGGVKSINKFEDGPSPLLTPYATMGQSGDYHANGSLAHFLQGNGVQFSRVLDQAERLLNLSYATGFTLTCDPETGNGCFPCDPPPGESCAGPIWGSGEYGYDGVGNIKSIGQDSFMHDRLNRLKNATISRHQYFDTAHNLDPAGFVNMSYDYDVYGNILKRYQTNLTSNDPYRAGTDIERFGSATTNRDYQNGPVAPDNKIHKLDVNGLQVYLYDGNGNLVSDGIKDFIYDELNQQIEVREPTTACPAAQPGNNGQGIAAGHVNKKQIKSNGQPTGFVPANVACYGKGLIIESNIYSADGMRVMRHLEKVVSASRVAVDTVYVRLNSNVVMEYTEEKRVPASTSLPEVSHEKAYIYGPLGLLATEAYCSFNCDANANDVAGATTRYYEYDHLGTVRAITNGYGKLESTFDYEPFGLELKGTTASFTDTSSNTHKFTGHERDEEAGVDYMKARMYVLSTARFPQIDPKFDGAGNPQNWNAYVYVGNSPVGSSDPTGMRRVEERPPSYGQGSGGGGGGGGDDTCWVDPKACILGANVADYFADLNGASQFQQILGSMSQPPDFTVTITYASGATITNTYTASQLSAAFQSAPTGSAPTSSGTATDPVLAALKELIERYKATAVESVTDYCTTNDCARFMKEPKTNISDPAKSGDKWKFDWDSLGQTVTNTTSEGTGVVLAVTNNRGNCSADCTTTFYKSTLDNYITLSKAGGSVPALYNAQRTNITTLQEFFGRLLIHEYLHRWGTLDEYTTELLTKRIYDRYKDNFK